MAPSEQRIVRDCYLLGQQLPDRIKNAPELMLGSELYLHAFFDLDSERSHAMGLTRIPWSSVKDYAAAFEFDETQTEDLYYYIRKMDAANLERLSEQLPT